MYQTRSSKLLPDEYPVRPSNVLKTELQQHNSKVEKKETYTLVLLCTSYFIFGSGIALYGPLYPPEAEAHNVEIYIYGTVLACYFLAAILFYPIACRMVTTVTCKQAGSMSLFVIGICKILFGCLSLIFGNLPFVILSFAILIMEGLGLSLLIASSFVIKFAEVSDKLQIDIGIIQISLLFGLVVGAVCGEAINHVFGFSITFYSWGVLTVLDAVLIAVLLPEPDQTLTYTEMPILSWTRKPRMLIYFLIVFITLNYTGFLIVILQPYLQQFNLNKIFVGALFSISPFACILFGAAGMWITQKGVNSILLICIASLAIFTSLALIGPAPIISINVSLTYTSLALLLNGIGIGVKLACVLNAANRDLKTLQSVNLLSDTQSIFTMFTLGCLLGCCTGSITASFIFYYFGVEKATYSLLGLESISFAVSFVFAFKRQYRNPRHPLTDVAQE